jgi:hypothetical protein
MDFKIGDFVKWTGEKAGNNRNEKRIDVITGINPAIFGGIEIYTKEINAKTGDKPKIGKGYPEYFVKVG